MFPVGNCDGGLGAAEQFVSQKWHSILGAVVNPVLCESAKASVLFQVGKGAGSPTVSLNSGLSQF